jgi:uncharacterized protein YggE
VRYCTRDANTRVGFRATTGITVKIVDFDRIAPLLQRAVDDADAEIRNLQWVVSENHPARHTPLGAAAIDATHRADAYAEALSLQRGPVEVVSDLPMVASPSARPEMAMMRSKSADTAPR